MPPRSNYPCGKTCSERSEAMMKRFSVIGTGRLGTSLAAALAEAGWKPVLLIDRDETAAAESRKLVGSGRAGTSAAKAGSAEDIVIISVPDDAIAAAVKELASNAAGWSGLTVFHTSGMVSADVLRPLKKLGAATASLHPIQSFPRKTGKADDFWGIFWAVQGDPAAMDTSRELIATLRGNLLSVSAKDKEAVHLACSLASNALVALENAAVSILAETGLDEARAWSVLEPLVRGTMRNMELSEPRKALSGPAVRGDLGTIRRHLKRLAGKPLETGIYLACLREALELIPKGTLPEERIKAMKRLAGRK